MKIAANKRGVTLVELMVGVAILGIVAAASYTMLVTGIKTYNRNINNTVSQQHLRAAMMQVTKQVRNAPAGAAEVTGSKVLTVSSTNFTVSAGKLQYGGKTLADGIDGITADYTDGSKKTIQVDLEATDGNTLSTRIRVN